LVLLVISCPCALVISIPLGYFGGIGGASRRGVLVKGANYLDALTKVDTIVLDKTGTLTKGVFKVTEVTPEANFSRNQVLELAAYAETFSTHPIATSIRAAYGGEVDQAGLSDYVEIAGHGIKVKRDGKTIVVGNDRMLHAENVVHPCCEAAGTVAYVAVEGKLAGEIIIADEIKPDAAEAIRQFKQMGVKRLVLLSGDDVEVAGRVAAKVGIAEFYAGLLPQDKVTIFERVEQERKLKNQCKGSLVFVGDGINDAPVLTRANIGIAMGGLGSDAAIEAADVVIMDDQPAKIAGAMQVARRTRAIVLQNIGLALGVKLVFVILGMLGVATIWEAVFADVGVALLAVFNASRVLRY
jgi:Zn2+/Cd2+-exporting ATPase